MSDKETNNQIDERDALTIINDPKYRVTADDIKAEQDAKATSGLTRREMLQYGGAAAAALSVAGSAATGFATGRAPEGYTGWGRTALGKDQFFNREPFRAEVAAMMVQEGPPERMDWYDEHNHLMKMTTALTRKIKWTPKDGVDAIPGFIGDFFRSHPEKYKFLVELTALQRKRFAYAKTPEGQQELNMYALHKAWGGAYTKASRSSFGYTVPEDPDDALRLTGEVQPPEKWDFRHIDKNKPKMVFKSPKHASELIKTMGHMFGASFVAITPFDERFMYKNMMRGYPNGGFGWGDKVPEHWKSMIVLACPAEWDKSQSGSFVSAADGYFRIRVVAGLLDFFIQSLGYPARPETPVSTFEVSMVPYVLASGLGEYARAGYAMIPEVGALSRLGGVITNIDFEYDKPINIGMANFCKKCKICAETCPSGAIEMGDEPAGMVRGVRRWKLDANKCHKGWWTSSTAGCSVCISVCPFTRKNTWIHAISRELDARDITGLAGSTLLAMQQNFFKYPKAEEFMAEYAGGRNAPYHNPPMWQRSEEWFSNVEADWEWDGLH